MFRIFLAFLVLISVCSAAPHPQGTVRKVLAGWSNTTGADACFSYQEEGEDIVRPASDYNGIALGTHALHIHEYDMYVGCGVPNSTAADQASVATSMDGRSWTSVLDSWRLCPVATAAAFGRGVVVVSCSGSYITLGNDLEVLGTSSTTNALLSSTDRMASVQPVDFGTLGVGSIRTVVYSEMSVRFVAAGLDSQGNFLIITSRDGISWSSVPHDVPAGQVTFPTVPSTIVYHERKGWVVATATQRQSGQGTVLTADDGASMFQFSTLSSLLVDPKRFTSCTYVNTVDRYYCFSIDGEAAKRKRLARAAVKNMMAGSVGSTASIDPVPVSSGDPIVSVATAAFLPLADELFVGGLLRIGSSETDQISFDSIELCTEECTFEPAPSASIPPPRLGIPGPSPPEQENQLNRTGGMVLVYGASSPQVVRRNRLTDVNLDGFTNGTVVLEPSETLDVSTESRIGRPMGFFRQVGSLACYNATVRVRSTGKLTVRTNLHLAASTLAVEAGHALDIKYFLVIDAGSSLMVDAQVTDVNTTRIEVVVANYSSGVLGRFDAVTLTNTPFVVVNRASETCESTFSDVQTNYNANSLTVVASVQTQCAETGGLSTGAIVGIAIGAVVGGAAIAVGIVVLTKYLIAQHTVAANNAILMKDVQM